MDDLLLDDPVIESGGGGNRSGVRPGEFGAGDPPLLECLDDRRCSPGSKLISTIWKRSATASRPHRHRRPRRRPGRSGRLHGASRSARPLRSRFLCRRRRSRSRSARPPRTPSRPCTAPMLPVATRRTPRLPSGSSGMCEGSLAHRLGLATKVADRDPGCGIALLDRLEVVQLVCLPEAPFEPVKVTALRLDYGTGTVDIGLSHRPLSKPTER